MRCGWICGLLASLAATACAPASGASEAGAEDGESGGATSLVCDTQWTVLEEQPFDLTRAFKGENLFVSAGPSHLITYASTVWTVHELPEELLVRDVWASAADSVWILDERPDRDRLLHWDGTGLEVALERSHAQDSLRALWGTGPNDVWAVGKQGCAGGTGCNALLLRFDGVSWAEQDGLGLPGLNAVFGRGADDVFLGAESGATAHWDGATWTPFPTGANPILRIVGDAQFVYAYGDPIAYRWHGDGWSALQGVEPVPATFLDLGVLDGDLWGLAGGFGGYAYRFDGTQWESFDEAGIDGVALASGGGELWISVREPFLPGSVSFASLDADGVRETQWSADYVVHGRSLRAVSFDELHSLGQTELGLAPARLVEDDWRWWPPDASERAAADLWVEAPGRVWALGRSAVGLSMSAEIRLYAEDDAHVVEFPDVAFDDPYPYALWVGDAEDMWVLGGHGAYHWDGGNWLAAAYPPGEVGTSIRSAGGHNYLGGQQGIYELINGEWTTLRSGADGYAAMDVAAPRSLWALEFGLGGEEGVIAWDGEEWTRHELGNWNLCWLHARAPDDVFVLGRLMQGPANTRHAVLHWDGRAWTRIPAPDLGCAEMQGTDEGIVLHSGTQTHRLACVRESSMGS